MEFIRIKDKVINLEYVKAIFLGEEQVIFDDGTKRPIVFATPEAGLIANVPTTPIDKSDLTIIIEDLRIRFPKIID